MNIPDRTTLQKQFDSFTKNRDLVARDLLEALEGSLKELPSRPAIKSRPKDFASYYKKYIRLLKTTPEGEEPLITDLVGLRIVCPFLEDLSTVVEVLQTHFSVLEVDSKGAHFSFKEFGYESVHVLIEIPAEILEKRGACGCTVAEIQIRTILQDAWAEVEHELVYKQEFTPFDDPMKRRLAAVNASLSLADSIFQEIRTYQRQLNGELSKRRDSFFRKIEEVTDGRIFTSEKAAPVVDYAPLSQKNTIDDLLLNALYAHNKGRFGEAIEFYTRILELEPDNNIKALIYKHRGMGNFAQSSYEDAILDFDHALEYDPASYKAAYYRGVVRSVLGQYPRAIDDFNQSLAINPYQNFTLYRRGQAYYHLEDYPAALADCEASLALDPESESAQKFRALLLEKLKMIG